MTKLIPVLVVTMSLLFFQNCQPLEISNNFKNSNSSARLKNPPPVPFCGEKAYKFLMDEYFTSHCSTCHDQKGFAEPKFVMPSDPLNSYYSAKLITKKKFLESIEHNEFCGPDCNLSPEGETYKAIEAWIDNSTCL